MKLIDKDALVAEIERMMAEEMAIFEESLKDGSHEVSAAPVAYTRLQMLLSAVNTIEVKEVDLEKEIGKYLDVNNIEYGFQVKLFDFAKHFFELGMSVSNKAQKGEEV